MLKISVFKIYHVQYVSNAKVWTSEYFKHVISTLFTAYCVKGENNAISLTREMHHVYKNDKLWFVLA